MGANPKKVATWEPMLEQLSGRLNAWGNKYVSLGGRIVLLNSILNVVPIFYLSFLKIPIKVLKMDIRIQREFLWGGFRGGRNKCWVKWRKVCEPRGKGGEYESFSKMEMAFTSRGQFPLEVCLLEKYGGSISGSAPADGFRWPCSHRSG